MEKVKIKNFTDVITGGTPSTAKDEYWVNGNIPWLNSGELNQKIVTTSRNYITKLGLEKSSSRLMPNDTVLMALTGSTTGVVGYLTFEACANQSVTGILPSKKHNSKYLYHYLNHIRPKVVNDAYGGAQPHISQGYVKELEIPLPPIHTQQKIAAILDKADELRQYNKQLIEKYDALTQSLFLDMFGDPIKNNKGWDKIELKKVTSKIGSGSTPRGGKEAYHSEGISLIRSLNIYDNEFKYKNLAFINDDQANKLKNVAVETNDVLFNITGASVCRCTVVPNDVLPARVNQHVSILRPISNQLHPLFLSHLLISENIKIQLLGVGSAGGAIMEAITKEQLEKFKIPIPPIELQNLFAKRVQLIATQKQQALETMAKSKLLFQGLLQQAFNGELN